MVVVVTGTGSYMLGVNQWTVQETSYSELSSICVIFKNIQTCSVAVSSVMPREEYVFSLVWISRQLVRFEPVSVYLDQNCIWLYNGL